MINEYMRKKKEGLNLKEKIEEHLAEIKEEKDLVHLIDDAFFKNEVDRGVEFKVRRANFITGSRMYDIIDEIAAEEQKRREFEEKEAARDMTYEEFLVKYGDMIDGKEKTSREDRALSTHSRPVTGHRDEDGKSEGGAYSDKRRAKNSSAMSKGSNTGGPNSMNNTKEGFDIKDDLKYDIPDKCYHNIMKGCKISKMDKKYKLMAHPYPLLEGEMILI